ncbi:MAG: CBS domain-containing protein [Desulfuromonadales bacterium]|nr:CBS domain-containing protein [Desulfuromonadales bacterium]
MLKAQDIMTREIRSVPLGTSIEELARLFEETRYNALPVVDAAGKLVGTISQNDLVERDRPLHIPTVISIFDWVLYVESEKNFVQEVKRMAARTVDEIYSEAKATCTPETPVDQVAALMSDKKAHLIPVLDGEKLVGVIARLDIIRSMNP